MLLDAEERRVSWSLRLVALNCCGRFDIFAFASRLISTGKLSCLQQHIDLDNVGPPVRELPNAGRSRADAGEVGHGEAGQGLRGARERH
jgi:hypothetical protein